MFSICSAGVMRNAVTAVRFWSLTDTTRVVVETTGDFELHSDRVPNPDRLFFDLKGATLKIGGKGQHTINVADHLLKQIRVAETQPGTTRVVFDLEANVEFTASQLSNPSRLIIELRSASDNPAPLTPSVTGVQKLDSVPGEVLPEPKPALAVDAKPAAKSPVTVAAPVLTAARSRVDALPDPTLSADKAIQSMPVATVPAPKVNTAKPGGKVPEPSKAVEKALAAKLPKSGDPALTRVLGLKIGRIVLDAGHGGHDTGTIGPTGLTEKELVLDVTKRLGALIENRMGSEVIYTRSDDTFIPLEHRTAIANEHKADLFLSVHANSSPVKVSSGVETYYLNFTTSKSALEVAARENATSTNTVYDLKDLLQKIALKDKVEESREFAARVQTSLFSFSAKGNSHAKDRGVKKAPFVVLIGASMPSVLAEIGFISNPRDESAMRRPEYRQKLAEALYKGLSQYAGTLSHFQVAAAGSPKK